SWSFSGRSAVIAVKQGTPASSPVAPTLTQNDTTYEFPLADARVNAGSTTVTTLTDRRTYTVSAGGAATGGGPLTGELIVPLVGLGDTQHFITANGQGGAFSNLIISNSDAAGNGRINLNVDDAVYVRDTLNNIVFTLSKGGNFSSNAAAPGSQLISLQSGAQ